MLICSGHLVSRENAQNAYRRHNHNAPAVRPPDTGYRVQQRQLLQTAVGTRDMISSFQNFTGAVPPPPPPYSHPAVYDPARGQHQLHPAAYSAAQRGVFTTVGQHPVPYHHQQADYGPSPYTPPPPPPPSRHYEPHRPAAASTPDPPNRKKPPQQPPTPVQYTRVQGGVPGGTI